MADSTAFSDDDLLPISALQHLAFCERQCALIHIEGIWAENRLTIEGRNLHAKVTAGEPESRGDLRISRSLRLRSLKLGLTGIADVVEFHRCGEGEPGASLPGVAGLWQPFPVEYKRGRPKPDQADMVQLCAQALCLEEMLGIDIPDGAIFYGTPRRRQEVTLTPDLRAETADLAARLHELIRRGVTPPALYEKKCDNCSLKDHCLPKVADGRRTVLPFILARWDDKDD